MDVNRPRPVTIIDFPALRGGAGGEAGHKEQVE
jgi:hypothetical protein